MTEEQMRALDETPTRRRGGRIFFFKEQGEVEHRAAGRRFPRRERAENLNVIHQWILEKEERLEPR